MPIKFVAGLLAALVCISLLSLPSLAQQAPPPSDPEAAAPQNDSSATAAPSGKQTGTAAAPSQSSGSQPSGQKGNDQAPPGTGQGRDAGTSNDRLFYALPNFLTLETRKQLPPLTVGQKFWVVTRGSFDYIQIPWYGFLSGISQAENSEPGYGQGTEGYFKRYASAFADGTIENYFTGAVLPAIGHQDPRYYQLGEGSFTHRTLYAMSRNLITLSDSGHKQFNYSEVAGGGLSAAISTYSYHPRSFFTYHYNSSTGVVTPIFHPSDRTFDNTMKVWGTQYGYDTLTLVVKEFWPDVRKALRKYRHQPETPPAPAK